MRIETIGQLLCIKLTRIGNSNPVISSNVSSNRTLGRPGDKERMGLHSQQAGGQESGRHDPSLVDPV